MVDIQCAAAEIRRGKKEDRKRKKERKSIYIAPFCKKVHAKRSGMDHTVLPANNTMPAFPSWRSPDVTTTAFPYPPHLKNVTTLPCKMQNFFI